MLAFAHLFTLAEFRAIDSPLSSNPDESNEDRGFRRIPFCQQIIEIRQRLFAFFCVAIYSFDPPQIPPRPSAELCSRKVGNRRYHKIKKKTPRCPAGDPP